MNWLLGAVVLLIAAGIAWGLFRGAIMMIYSMVSWLAALLIVSLATPIISAAVISGTSIDERIEEQTVSYLRGYVQEHGGGSLEKADQALGQEELSAFGIKLPTALTGQLTETEGLPDQALQSLGVYERVARYISHLIIQGATFMVVLLVVRVALFVAGYSLKIISKLKGIREINRAVGAAVGCAEALLIVWIGFAAVAFVNTSGVGQAATELIYQSWLLRLLYENNLVVAMVGSLL